MQKRKKLLQTGSVDIWFVQAQRSYIANMTCLQVTCTQQKQSYSLSTQKVYKMHTKSSSTTINMQKAEENDLHIIYQVCFPKTILKHPAVLDAVLVKTQSKSAHFAETKSISSQNSNKHVLLIIKRVQRLGLEVSLLSFKHIKSSCAKE